MPAERFPDDAAARERALDPGRSFIVQAPAGSGKTELLTQRFLRLLSVVDQPEEILAITFTRKAAGEMLHRILSALEGAAGTCPPEAHKARTWRLARAARERDEALGWGLRLAPGRLHVQTIDGLCTGLTRQLPVLSALGAPPAIREAPEELYTEAARRTLAALEGDLAEPLGVLLPHLDNAGERLVRLVANLLPRREQWLRHLLGAQPRARLEAALRRVVEDRLAGLAQAMPPGLGPELAALAHYAASHRPPRDTTLDAWREPRGLPDGGLDALPAWQGLAQLLLVSREPAALRRQVNARDGFPAPGSTKDAEQKVRYAAFKERFKALTEALAPYGEFLERLSDCRFLPPVRYSEGDWQVLQSLRTVLVRAAAELALIFAEYGEVDFTEVHLRAVTALGSGDEPTDLGLALDYRLRHILVDEFQDTSSGQYRLLEQLTAGWEADDGRTLFAVGDPMQSIYGFREAEVGLFLRARGEGIGRLRLEPLTLGVNFRSRANLVDWVNRAFQAVLPESPDPAAGAVPFTPSAAYHDGEADAAVEIHAWLERSDDAEAQRIVALVASSLETYPGGDVAILGRSRSHLSACAQALRTAGIPFQAVELEPLAGLGPVQDLRSLTRALLHPGDRLAWLSVLRAPWCGLQLADLLAVAGEGLGDPIWPRLSDPAVVEGLSPSAQQRVNRFVGVLAAALRERRRRPLRRWVEGAWIALGGPATLADATAREAARSFLALLEKEAVAEDLPDLAAFDAALGRLYAPADVAADGRVQLMTMHKAKGLEFDVVILPGLGRKPRRSAAALLEWQERPGEDEETDLLLAPIPAAGEERGAIQDYLRRLAASKARLEEGRLLYVAATRARRRLYLLGHATPERQTGEPRPDNASLLARLWPVVADAFARSAETLARPQDAAPAPQGWPLRRLPLDWRARPLASDPLPLPPPVPAPAKPPLTFDWAGQTARHVGTLVHRWLERIAREGLERWPVARVGELTGRLETALMILGVGDAALPGAVNRCAEALQRTLSDERGRWILTAHREHRVEYPLTGSFDGALRHYVIDRTFVDEAGTRWIIDYKTGQHEGGDPTAFLDRERERYREQLEAYARLFRVRDARPIRLGLYFPLMRGWREWPHGG